MLPRYTLLALIALPLALALSASLTRQAGAQTPCENGFAGEYPCQDIDLLAQVPLDELTDDLEAGGNDIWGWTDPETGKEYALYGLTNGTVFIDVSTPTEPVVVGTLPSELEDNCTWRDIKTYANHAFIVADCPVHGMQVFDLTRLRETNPPETFNDTDAYYTGIERAHNIVINEEAGLAFPVGSDVCSASLEILDISNPLEPSPLGCSPNHMYIHDAQCVRYSGPDTDYTGRDICFNLNAPSFDSSNRYVSIVDVTNPENPDSISHVFYPDPDYPHQGWLTDDHAWFIVDDETDERDDEEIEYTRTLFFDVSDLDDPDFAYFKEGATTATDHNLYVRDGLMYQTNYRAGLRIWDVRTPEVEESVTELAFFDTYPEDDDVGFEGGTWSSYPFFESGIVIANSRDRGLFVLQPTSLPIGNGSGPETPEALRVELGGPNPTDGETALVLTAPSNQTVSVELFDVRGRLLRVIGTPLIAAGVQTSMTVDVRDLSAGTYFLRVQGEQEVVTKRIAVVR